MLRRSIPPPGGCGPRVGTILCAHRVGVGSGYSWFISFFFLNDYTLNILIPFHNNHDADQLTALFFTNSSNCFTSMIVTHLRPDLIHPFSAKRLITRLTV